MTFRSYKLAQYEKVESQAPGKIDCDALITAMIQAYKKDAAASSSSSWSYSHSQKLRIQWIDSLRAITKDYSGSIYDQSWTMPGDTT